MDTGRFVKSSSRTWPFPSGMVALSILDRTPRDFRPRPACATRADPPCSVFVEVEDSGIMNRPGRQPTSSSVPQTQALSALTRKRIDPTTRLSPSLSALSKERYPGERSLASTGVSPCRPNPNNQRSFAPLSRTASAGLPETRPGAEVPGRTRECQAAWLRVRRGRCIAFLAHGIIPRGGEPRSPSAND